MVANRYYFQYDSIDGDKNMTEIKSLRGAKLYIVAAKKGIGASML